jgi:hypothetical protein
MCQQERRAQELQQAVESLASWNYMPRITFYTEDNIKTVLGKSNGFLAVVLSPEKQLRGILTPFDCCEFALDS